MSPLAQTTTGLRGVQLTVRYHPRQPVVIDNQSIAIPPKQINVLIGPNGSGKSTLLKTLARQLKPETGQVLMDGTDIGMMPRRQFARRLGILFQENLTPSGLTVEELAYHGRYAHRRLFESFTPEDHAAVEDALRLAGIEQLRHRWISHLSAGQRQLAWVAMILAQATDYMFLDEPTTFLDLIHQFELMDLLRRLNRELGKTLVLVLHDLNLAARYADHIFALREGKIVATGSPQEVLTPVTLRDVFGVEAHVIHDTDGQIIACNPIRAAANNG